MIFPVLGLGFFCNLEQHSIDIFSFISTILHSVSSLSVIFFFSVPLAIAQARNQQEAKIFCESVQCAGSLRKSQMPAPSGLQSGRQEEPEFLPLSPPAHHIRDGLICINTVCNDS